MLTAWGKKIVALAKVQQYCLPYVTVASSDPAVFEGKLINGTTIYTQGTYHSTPSWAPITSAITDGSSGSIGVAFGSDDTPPNENNYTLGNQVTGFGSNTPGIITIFDAENNKYLARLNYFISNDTGSAITIAEVGLFVRFNCSTTKGSTSFGTSSRHSLLMDRTVLATPVTIANGEGAAIRYEFAYDT